MISKPRLEAKYLLDPVSYRSIRNALVPYCRHDDYSKRREGHLYPVRSLYFDGDGFPACVEKHHGVNLRNKLRIRSYTLTREETKYLKVEQKRRVGRMVYKCVDRVSLKQYENFLATGSWGDSASEELQDFEFQMRQKNLTPRLVVDYQREALFARDGSGARFCFDRNIRYARSRDIFCEKQAFRNDLNKNIVFEIKVDRDDQYWISKFVRDNGLRSVPNSKYANAVTLSQVDTWF